MTSDMLEIYESTGAFASNMYPLCSSPWIDLHAELGGIYLFRLARKKVIFMIYSWLNAKLLVIVFWRELAELGFFQYLT